MKWVDYLQKNITVFTNLLPKYDIEYQYTSRILEQLEYRGEYDIEKMIVSFLDETYERDIQSGHTHI